MSMTREEAIRRIQSHMRNHHIGEYPHIYIKEALDMAIDALREQEESRWIPVTERMPEYETPVMGWDAELRDMGIVNFVYGQFLDIIDMSEVNVTHWKPLPAPPKEETT